MTHLPLTDISTVPQRSRANLYLWVGLLLLLTAVFVALGVWQIERLHWKLDLIARVDARVHAQSQPAPDRSAWTTVNAADDEYRHVRIGGTLQNDAETYVYASTDLGPGYWVITPLKGADGTTTLINRGFVPTDRRDPRTRSEGEVSEPTTITGLLRISEPKGTLMRSNVPADDRWYSRDVTAIAAERHLQDVAPYFIDADNAPNPGGLPVGGLTQIVFPNSHLSYALTWFGMAIMSLGMTGYLIVSERRRKTA
jgi:surfeit locus 1 family protein